MSRIGPVGTGLLLCCTMRVTASGQTAPEAEVKALVQQFFAAEKAYDAVALTKLVEPSYVEISPVGELDAHDRFLGFYTADKKTDWPPITVSEEQVRIFGDTAIETLRTGYTMPDGKGGTRELAIRGSFVAQRRNGTWKLIGAQYTGIRPAPAAGK